MSGPTHPRLVRLGRDIRGELRSLQGARCGICGVPELLNGRLLELDHDHDSGWVRGLLCRRCNRAEGFHGRCEIPTRCAICLWRIRPATCWLGWTERYVDLNGYTEAGRFGELGGPWEPSREPATGVTYEAWCEERRGKLEAFGAARRAS